MKLFQTFLQVRVIYISRGTVNLNQILTLLKTYLSEVQIGKKILHFQVDFIRRQDECANIYYCTSM